MGTDNLPKVLEKLATSEKTTLMVEKEHDGKTRVSSRSWEGGKVFLRNRVLEVRNVEGPHPRREEATPAIEPYDPYGPGTTDEESDTSQFWGVTRHMAETPRGKSLLYQALARRPRRRVRCDPNGGIKIRMLCLIDQRPF